MQGVRVRLHHALAALRAEHPGVVVRLRRAAVADIRQALCEGTVDLAVVALDRQQQRGLATRLLSHGCVTFAGLWSTSCGATTQGDQRMIRSGLALSQNGGSSL